MKKLLALLLIFVITFSISACGSASSEVENNNGPSDSETFATNENAQLFFDKIIENKTLLDPIFRAVCSAWKAEESKDGATVSDVNKAIDDAIKQHNTDIATINAADESINELYELAKKCPASSNVEAVMTSYNKYKDSVLKADASTNPGGYNDASSAKNSLDKALRNFRTVLGE